MTLLDGRSRLACALALSVAVAVCHTWPAALAGLGLGAASLALCRVEPARLLARLALVNLFFLGIVATVPLAVPGPPAFRLGPLAYTWPGLWLALLMTAKGNAIMLLFWGLVRPLTPTELGAALSGLGAPDKLCLLLSLTWRYLGLMRQEWDRMFTAARLRGFRPGTSRRAWGVYATLLAMLFVRAMDRSTAIHQAMVCRGFDGRFRALGGAGWRGRDTALCLAGLVATLLVIVVEKY